MAVDKTDAAGVRVALPVDSAPQGEVQSNVLQDNAPRIVGAIKFLPDSLLFLSGLQEKVYSRSVAALGFVAARTIWLLHADKNKKDIAVAESIVNVPSKSDESFAGQVKYNAYKLTHPGQYPVESGAGVAALAGVAVAVAGVSQMRNKATFKQGVIEAGIGVSTALAEGNVLYGQEKSSVKSDAVSKGEGGVLQTLKEQPVLLSGIAQAAISGSQIVLGVMKLKDKTHVQSENAPWYKKPWFYLGAASIYTAADLVYAFFVKKNDFNVESKTMPTQNLDAVVSIGESGDKHKILPSQAVKNSQWQGVVQQHEHTQNVNM